jgi:SH3-like domain-containing protein
MEVQIIHNVPYYCDVATNKLYTWNDSKTYVGTYNPTTHAVTYRPDGLPNELLGELAEWRKSQQPNGRKKIPTVSK